jgi:O-antigen ligase
VTAGVHPTRWVLATGLLLIACAVGVLAGIDPIFALGASAAVVFVLIAFTNLAAGLVLFVLIAFLEFLFAGGPVLSLTKATGMLLALAWLAEITRPQGARNYFVDHPFGGFLLIAFLVWALVGLGWAESSAATLEDVLRYLLVMALLVITYSAARDRTRIAWIVGAFLVGTAIAAALALASPPSSDPTEVARVESTFGNANQLATVLVAGLVLAIAVATAVRRATLVRSVTIGIATLCAIALVLTGSRSGVISLAVALVATVLMAGPGRRGPALVGAGLAALAAVALFVTFAPDGIKERIAQTTPGQVPATESRLTIWQVGWRMFEDNPVRGVGVGNFQTSSIHYLLQPGALTRTDEVIVDPKDAHNIYLMALAETGLVGTVLLLSLLGFPIGCAIVAARNFSRSGDRQLEIIARALVVALAGFLAANFFATDIFSKMLWLLLGLGPALLAVSRASLPEDDEEDPRSVS